MRQSKAYSSLDFNVTFFLWCFTLPIFVFMIALAVIDNFIAVKGDMFVTAQQLRSFLLYYDKYIIREFAVIFGNNFLAVLVVIYFTPVYLWFRKRWAGWRNSKTALTAFEKILLYLFPALFLIRQSLNIVASLYRLSERINENIIVTMIGVILPHGLPELIAFSITGAIAMGVTKKIISSGSSGKPINLNIVGLLCILTGLCAFVEVYFTPKIFALIMSLGG
jgi:hypothetical protein